MFCRCDTAIPDPDDLTCIKCGHASVAALMVDPVDVRLHRRRRQNYPALAGLERVQVVERPEDCERDCFKHGGTESCLCEEDGDGVWRPGC